MSSSPSSYEAIDRIAPTRRPDRAAVMYQRWAHLLFLHWTVPVDELRPLLPDDLEIDTYDGRAYVGLVPFTMTGVRPRGLPALPWLSSFHEVNVRTYVHHRGRDPGVWFFSLDAANPIAVKLARWSYHLPYDWARMSLVESRDPAHADAPPEIAYQSVRRRQEPAASCALRYRSTGQPAPARPGTLDHFLIERYILYAFASGTLYRGRVHHAPYPVQSADLLSLEDSLVAAAGLHKDEAPPLIHYAREVRVEIFPPERVEPPARFKKP